MTKKERETLQRAAGMIDALILYEAGAVETSLTWILELIDELLQEGNGDG